MQTQTIIIIAVPTSVLLVVLVVFGGKWLYDRKFKTEPNPGQPIVPSGSPTIIHDPLQVRQPSERPSIPLRKEGQAHQHQSQLGGEVLKPIALPQTSALNVSNLSDQEKHRAAQLAQSINGGLEQFAAGKGGQEGLQMILSNFHQFRQIVDPSYSTEQAGQIKFGLELTNDPYIADIFKRSCDIKKAVDKRDEYDVQKSYSNFVNEAKKKLVTKLNAPKGEVLTDQAITEVYMSQIMNSAEVAKGICLKSPETDKIVNSYQNCCTNLNSCLKNFFADYSKRVTISGYLGSVTGFLEGLDARIKSFTGAMKLFSEMSNVYEVYSKVRQSFFTNEVATLIETHKRIQTEGENLFSKLPKHSNGAFITVGEILDNQELRQQHMDKLPYVFLAHYFHYDLSMFTNSIEERVQTLKNLTEPKSSDQGTDKPVYYPKNWAAEFNSELQNEMGHIINSGYRKLIDSSLKNVNEIVELTSKTLNRYKFLVQLSQVYPKTSFVGFLSEKHGVKITREGIKEEAEYLHRLFEKYQKNVPGSKTYDAQKAASENKDLTRYKNLKIGSFHALDSLFIDLEKLILSENQTLNTLERYIADFFASMLIKEMVTYEKNEINPFFPVLNTLKKELEICSSNLSLQLKELNDANSLLQKSEEGQAPKSKIKKLLNAFNLFIDINGDFDEKALHAKLGEVTEKLQQCETYLQFISDHSVDEFITDCNSIIEEIKNIINFLPNKNQKIMALRSLKTACPRISFDFPTIEGINAKEIGEPASTDTWRGMIGQAASQAMGAGSHTVKGIASFLTGKAKGFMSYFRHTPGLDDFQKNFMNVFNRLQTNLSKSKVESKLLGESFQRFGNLKLGAEKYNVYKVNLSNNMDMKMEDLNDLKEQISKIGTVTTSKKTQEDKLARLELDYNANSGKSSYTSQLEKVKILESNLLAKKKSLLENFKQFLDKGGFSGDNPYTAQFENFCVQYFKMECDLIQNQQKLAQIPCHELYGEITRVKKNLEKVNKQCAVMETTQSNERLIKNEHNSINQEITALDGHIAEYKSLYVSVLGEFEKRKTQVQNASKTYNDIVADLKQVSTPISALKEEMQNTNKPTENIEKFEADIQHLIHTITSMVGLMESEVEVLNSMLMLYNDFDNMIRERYLLLNIESELKRTSDKLDKNFGIIRDELAKDKSKIKVNVVLDTVKKMKKIGKELNGLLEKAKETVTNYAKKLTEVKSLEVSLLAATSKANDLAKKARKIADDNAEISRDKTDIQKNLDEIAGILQSNIKQLIADADEAYASNNFNLTELNNLTFIGQDDLSRMLSFPDVPLQNVLVVLENLKEYVNDMEHDAQVKISEANDINIINNLVQHSSIGLKLAEKISPETNFENLNDLNTKMAEEEARKNQLKNEIVTLEVESKQAKKRAKRQRQKVTRAQSKPQGTIDPAYLQKLQDEVNQANTESIRLETELKDKQLQLNEVEDKLKEINQERSDIMNQDQNGIMSILRQRHNETELKLNEEVQSFLKDTEDMKGAIVAADGLISNFSGFQEKLKSKREELIVVIRGQ